jgi:hypothetical protein
VVHLDLANIELRPHIALRQVPCVSSPLTKQAHDSDSSEFAIAKSFCIRAVVAHWELGLAAGVSCICVLSQDGGRCSKECVERSRELVSSITMISRM